MNRHSKAPKTKITSLYSRIFNKAKPQAFIDAASERAVTGWSWDASDPTRRMRLELFINGQKIETFEANKFRQDLADAQIGDGHYSFDCAILPGVLVKGENLIALVDHSNGSLLAQKHFTIASDEPQSRDPKPEDQRLTSQSTELKRKVIGHIDGKNAENEFLRGWAYYPSQPDCSVEIKIFIDGKFISVVDARLDRIDLREKNIGTGHHGFEFIPPLKFCDAKPHKVRIEDHDSIVIAEAEIRFSKGKRKSYTNFTSFMNAAVNFHMLERPFLEVDNRCFAFMELEKKRLAAASVDFDLPKVSVIMPVYNRDKIVRRAIESVLNQSHRNLELIVVDDGSTDYSVDIVRSFSDERLTVAALAVNGGVSAARNHGLDLASGDFIAYLDSDNEWDLEFLKVMLTAIRESDEFHMAYCAQYVCNSCGDKPAFVRFGPFNRALMENRNFVDLNAFVHHRRYYEQLGGFDQSLRRYVDWDLILRYTASAGILAVPALLSYYYRHEADVTITRHESASYLNNFRRKMLHEHGIGTIRDNKVEWTLSEVDIDDCLAGSAMPIVRARDKTVASEKPPFVSIVIPSYNSVSELRMAIEAIMRFTPEECYECIIVDNASDGETVKYLQTVEREDRFKVIYLPENYGFTHAVNVGIKAGSGVSDVIIMNNDAIVTENWLHGLYEVVRKHPNAGIVCPRQVLPAYSRTLKQHCPTAAIDFETDVTLSSHHQNVIDYKFDVIRGFIELSYVPFFCVLVRREVLTRVGLLDAEFGRHYRSDQVYCDAVRVKDFKIVYTPNSKVYHLLQRSTQELAANNEDKYQEIFVKNAWSKELGKKLGFKEAPWQEV